MYLLKHGNDERSIMAMTGHKSTQMVRRYIREANIFKNNALNKKLKFNLIIKKNIKYDFIINER